MTKIHQALVLMFLSGLLLSEPASGLGRTSFKWREFVLFLSRIPQLMPTDPASRASFYFAHQLGTCLLAALVAGQAVAAMLAVAASLVVGAATPKGAATNLHHAATPRSPPETGRISV
jgi:cytochrome b561